MNKIKIMMSAIGLASSAVCADLFYIIARILRPVCTLDDVRFLEAVPAMIEHMLLSTAIIVAFGVLATYVLKEERK